MVNIIRKKNSFSGDAKTPETAFPKTKLLHKENLHNEKGTQDVTLLSRRPIDYDAEALESERERERRREERHSFRIESDIPLKTAIDELEDGSPFITSWFYWFTGGKVKVTFDRIFDPLIDGIRQEGELRRESTQKLNTILNELRAVKLDGSLKKEEQRMKQLEETCAKLYTKASFIFTMANETLRDNDLTKLVTVGPYCYLLFDYIGNQVSEHKLSGRIFTRQNTSKKSPSITVYRGDSVTEEKIKEYCEAVGQKSKYFKWLDFVSTSLDQSAAKEFGRNVIYEIELHGKELKDQFIRLEEISYFPDEREVLLRPGSRFHVNSVELPKPESKDKKVKIGITIVPSYITSIMR